MSSILLIIVTALILAALVAAAFCAGIARGWKHQQDVIMIGNEARTDELRSAFRYHSDMSYGSDPLQKLDIFLPEPADQPAPVLIFIHGGGWVECDKNQFSFAFGSLLERGIMVVSVNYRLAPAHRYPAAVEDCRDAVLWVREYITGFGGDPERLFLGGHSAGAHLAALTALRPQNAPGGGLPAGVIAGCIPIGGVYDFHTEIPYAYLRRFIRRQYLAEASPVTYLRPDAPPILIAHGDNDWMLPYPSAQRFLRAARKRDARACLVRLPRRCHVQEFEALGEVHSPLFPLAVNFIHSAELPPDSACDPVPDTDPLPKPGYRGPGLMLFLVRLFDILLRK